MANTVTQTTLVGGGSSKILVRHIQITSDGSQETNLVVYDNSAFVNNTGLGNVMKVTASGASCQVLLSWDQTTDFKVLAINPAYSEHICFKSIGGIRNPAGTGATGDLLLSTLGLSTGNEVTIIIEIYQN